jgi:ArsR family transcriptional regulator, cadmium/lead-responsive transcriptional repressor
VPFVLVAGLLLIGLVADHWAVRDRRTSPRRGRCGRALVSRRYHRWMTMILPTTVRAELGPAAALFRSLADPTRLAIVRRLAVGEARVVDLVAECGLAQSTVSKHLACLRDCQLVDSRPVGRASVFTLTQPALVEVLTAAETVLASTGNAVALCPTYGQPECGHSR